MFGEPEKFGNLIGEIGICRILDMYAITNQIYGISAEAKYWISIRNIRYAIPRAKY